MFKRIVLIAFIIITLSLSSCVFAVREWDEEHEFNPVDLLFCYNDHNTTTYEGDLGLEKTLCNNTIDNKTYRIPTGAVRGIAYATKKSFKFDEPIIMTHSSGNEPKMILTMKYKNGTVIPVLDYDTKGMTKEQMSYFDDFENQRDAYYDNKAYWQEADMEHSLSKKSSEKSSSSRYYYYVGTNGRGIVYDY